MDTDVEQHQSAQPAPAPSVPTLDMASSLRAAALLSRKRRRVDPDASALPPRLAPELTLQLDYGHDDPAAYKLSPITPPTAPDSAERTEDIEDGQIREEGEISDTETSPPPRWSPTPPPRLRQRPFVSQPQESARVENPLLSRLPSHAGAPAASPLEPSDAQAWQPARLEPIVLETSTYQLDVNHVRPGLSMTQAQYNTAKDIVLDLLGWGVPPEYLLECGLSRHVIFYVFSELNLRLPSNLDTSGLIPYPTPEMLALMPISPSLSTRSLHSSSSTMPPPSVIPARVTLAERMSMEHTDTRISSPDPSPYIKTEPSSPSSADFSNSSLLVIEQQRRQELLARKAAIASRKARQESLDFVTPSKDQDIDMSAIPTQSVDDFLKTIEPASHVDTSDNHNHNRGSSVGTTPLSPSERMDVDDSIPGLIGASRDTPTSLAGPSSAQSKSSSTGIYADVHSPVALPTESTDNAGSTSNGTEQASTTSVDTASPGPLTPTLQSNPNYAGLDGDGGYPQRRGMKRPVAADFVDFDSGPGPSRGYGSSYPNGHSNGSPHPNPLSRRKHGSFAGINGMRRCVIELSDSEDDSDNQVRGDHVGNSDGREYSPAVTTAFAARVPSRLAATPTMPSSSSVINGNAGQPFPTAPTTNALAEKEEEIKKMRQLIAQREDLRLKKLAAMSGKSTLGVSVAMGDGKQDLFTSDNSATDRISGTPGPINNRNDLSARDTSTIGSLSRFSASPTAG
ncbi:hypothetical protein L210DRAFT_3643849 [Boletus edulis BED1]|uniref:Uncharacterized protein n=1 Tax=Boletus edulis BED1 TaxID=1328754 RepID=A0AAD4BXJ9_BOLED|nr:hypothetical protein L210DRAFT_3643849 [Boletus edulis BED1]